MDIKRILSLAAAAALGTSSVAACSKSKKSDDNAPVPIVEETETVPTTTQPVVPDKEYPDYPVTIPEIQKQATGDFYEAEDCELKEGLKVAAEKENFSGKGTKWQTVADIQDKCAEQSALRPFFQYRIG